MRRRLLAKSLIACVPAFALVQAVAAENPVFFHLLTPLGVPVGNTDGSLHGGVRFALACGVWLSAAAIVALRWRELSVLSRRSGL